jgi:hypothetical protein
MTSDRARAYGRVMKTIDDLAATKLQPYEVDRIRDAADTCLFAEAVPSETLAEIRELVDHLVESDRWTEERAQQLLYDIEGCGPLTRV